MLKDTGERVIPEKMDVLNNLLIEHLARYHFSVPHARGRVLDIACGSGYGTHIIAKECKARIDEIIGVDIDPATLDYARATYYHPLSSFIKGNVTDPDLPEKLGQFDVILSFETIEHVHEEAQFMDNLYSMLKPGGTLILSTPFGKGRGIPSGQQFHVHQLTPMEFTALFTPYKNVKFYGQNRALIEPAAFHDNTLTHPLGIAVCQK
ncbi:Juvenile hormone-III synthase [Lentibacillus sp. JNUCC-1]|uniref:class I SAM-dependent methyltransferase n=1 Tax=Lentibacillus sp. JNUCC-1 TaxID=2654513 RepID=UPI0012E93893|nr:class I SAM-dependent methyltransferase [Lentibacillus sp. JNUCC-1]MUV37584.1 Juvenile hormone-III synthase [Lentibacillus sp. JNUCC-1]